MDTACFKIPCLVRLRMLDILEPFHKNSPSKLTKLLTLNDLSNIPEQRREKFYECILSWREHGWI